MTLLWTDGFDEYASADQMAQGNYLTAACKAFQSGRTGNCMVFDMLWSASVSRYIGSRTEIIVGFALLFNNTSPVDFMVIGTTAAACLRVAKTWYNGIEVYAQSGALLAASAAEVLNVNVWHYIEVKYVLGDAGMVVVRVDLDEVINQSSIDTLTGTVTTFDIVRLSGPGPTGLWMYYDDFYICDMAGAVNNDFLGDVRVYTLVPTGAGATTQLTPVGAGANWDCVNDATPDDATTYVTANVPGLRDTYQMSVPALPLVIVNGVLVQARAQKSDAGARNLQLVCSTGGMVGLSDEKTLTASSWKFHGAIWELQPAGGAWTWETLQPGSFEAGVQVV